jgi:hypothetical protein
VRVELANVAAVQCAYGDLAWRLVDLAALVCICGLIYAIFAPLSRLAGALVIALVALFHFSGGPNAIGERDFFTVAPAAAFVLFFERALNRPARADST